MTDARPASLPEPPYYAVVFTSLRTVGDNGYAETAREMFTLVRSQPGYLGADSVRGPDGLGITVAYLRDEESIAAWRAVPAVSLGVLVSIGRRARLLVDAVTARLAVD